MYSALRSVVLDSSSPYYSTFDEKACEDAVYFSGHDPLFGPVVAVVYENKNQTHYNRRLSSLLISSHGTSGFLDITLGPKSRYHSACLNLPEYQRQSFVRQALAITCLRAYATMDPTVKAHLTAEALQNQASAAVTDWDETNAGAMASRLRMMNKQFPRDIGARLLSLGAVSPKTMRHVLVDVVYVDSDATIEQNNELVYLLGDQLESLFDPAQDQIPDPSPERLYYPPATSVYTLKDDEPQVQAICEELYALQSNYRNDLVDFLQEFLTPVRIGVLAGGTDLSLKLLNEIFPASIDDVIRINNVFYEALQHAIPFGSFEVLRACALSIPAFVQACVGHEAATKRFYRTLCQHYDRLPLSDDQATRYSPRKIESLMMCSLHLVRIKMVLERLRTITQWTDTQEPLVADLFQTSVGTIDTFGRRLSLQTTYEPYLVTPSGKILAELTDLWPGELEHGWVNRRIVSAIDCVDNLTQHRLVLVLFTDKLVVLKPMQAADPDRLLAQELISSLVNNEPLDMARFPRLVFKSWTAVERVYVAEHQKSPILTLTIVPEAVSVPSSPDPGSQPSLAMPPPPALVTVVGAQDSAVRFVSAVAKAKIMNKTQPFHLFRSVGPQMTMYATVHELGGYSAEAHKCPVSVFLNVADLTRDVLTANGLSACFDVQLVAADRIRVRLYSELGHEFDRIVSRRDFSHLIVSQTAYVYTLFLSSRNSRLVPAIVRNNEAIASHLVSFGAPVPEPRPPVTVRKPSPAFRFLRVRTRSPTLRSSSLSMPLEPQRLTRPTISSIGPFRAAEAVDSVPEMSMSSSASEDDFEPRRMDTKRTTMIPRAQYGNIASDDEAASDLITGDGDFITVDGDSFVSVDSDSLTDSVISEQDLQHQRDVDAWFQEYGHSDRGSLSSSKDFDMSEQPIEGRRLTQVLDSVSSFEFTRQSPELPELPNEFASAPEFPELPDEYSDELRLAQDFSYLATLVTDDTTESEPADHMSKSSSDKLYPDLRDSSIAFLGSYVHSGLDRSPSSSSVQVDDEEDPQPSPSEGEWMSMISSRDSRRGSTKSKTSMLSPKPVSKASLTSHSSTRTVPPSPPPTPTPPLPPMISQANRSLSSTFYGSTNTLQLAAFTVDLDRVISTAKRHQDKVMAEAVDRLKDTAVWMYERTRHGAVSETAVRARLYPELWYAIGMRDQAAVAESLPQFEAWDTVVRGMLDVEWLRRFRREPAV